mmetsp:Transcript_20827/g.58177  ORF Transcript_20827/g.58177 Transcript_20827/m.58177 type:complete len:85 (+) Transcript_20827:579-833(+)
MCCLPTWLENFIDGLATMAIAGLACASACLCLFFVTGLAFMFYYPLQAMVMMGFSLCLTCAACGYLASTGSVREADVEKGRYEG